MSLPIYIQSWRGELGTRESRPLVSQSNLAVWQFLKSVKAMAEMASKRI
jgi:hypothetical protein